MSDYVLGILGLIKKHPDKWKYTNSNFWIDGWKYTGDEVIYINYRYVPRGEGEGMGIKYIPEDTSVTTYASWDKHLPALTTKERIAIYETAEKYLGEPKRAKQRQEEALKEVKDREDALSFAKRIGSFA